MAKAQDTTLKANATLPITAVQMAIQPWLNAAEAMSIVVATDSHDIARSKSVPSRAV
jgi:hypothetical protein